MDYKLKAEKFENRFLDIGTGDGRFVYKSAVKNPKNLYIGIDPASNLKEYQREINRKKLDNAILVNSSIENYNPDISDFYTGISVILPWGNLLKYVVIVETLFFQNIAKWLKKNSYIEIIFGFNEELEEKETKRLNLPDLTLSQIEKIKSNYQKLDGFELIEIHELTSKELEKFDSTWAKKLTFGANRKYLYIKLKKV